MVCAGMEAGTQEQGFYVCIVRAQLCCRPEEVCSIDGIAMIRWTLAKAGNVKFAN